MKSIIETLNIKVEYKLWHTIVMAMLSGLGIAHVLLATVFK